MIVRLKGRILLHSRPRSEFQFYDSPIKSPLSVCADIRLIECFNSMIVRLKGEVSDASAVEGLSFNSMIVRLKEVLYGEYYKAKSVSIL